MILCLYKKGLFTWFFPFAYFVQFLICCFFNLIWSTIFMENWKRKSSKLCYSWGIFNLELSDQPRPQFHGIAGVNPITGKHELYYSKCLIFFQIKFSHNLQSSLFLQRNKRMLQKYLVSYPIIAVSIVLAFVLMMAYYYANDIVIANFDNSTYLGMVMLNLPSILYSLLVIVFNVIYKTVSIILTEWGKLMILNLAISIVRAFHVQFLLVIQEERFFLTRKYF